MRRIRGQRAVEFACWSGGVLGAAAVVAFVASKPLFGLVAIAVWCVTVAIVWFLEVPLGRAARSADTWCGLDAAADTALHLRRTGHPAAEAVGLDAVDGLAGKAPPPVERPTGLWFLLGMLVAAGVAVGVGLQLEDDAGPAIVEDPLLTQLDAIEADARRKGQVELVEAVQDLRERVKAVREASVASPVEELARHEEPPAPLVVPPPPPPTEPEADIPAEFGSQDAYEKALDDARETMLSDDEMLAEFAGEIESRLMDIAQMETLGNQLFAETLRANEMSSFSGGSMEMDLGGSVSGTSQTMNQGMEQVGQDVPGPVDPAANSGMRDLEDTVSQEHELAQGLQQSYQDFLKAYADALRDELVEAISESEETSDQERNEGGDMSSQPTTGGGEQKEDATRMANLQIREQDSPATTARMADLPDGGGKPLNMTGSGAGGEPEGKEGVSQTGEAGGELEQLEGGFGPGNLSGEQRSQVLQQMSGKAMQTGPGSEFDDTWGGYFDEADRALVEDDMPPMMKGMVAAYFAGLKETQ
ncbi:MAG: hypothetical protein GY884_35465 [Proteobacteria bacterium]|nr:hypothetical protein [Pseudomonadota bacterium]